MIFYRVGPEDIKVVHVLHGAMDYEALFFRMGDLRWSRGRRLRHTVIQVSNMAVPRVPDRHELNGATN